MIPQKYKIAFTVLGLGFIIQLILNNTFHSTEYANSGWLYSVITARKNSNMKIYQQGTGAMVRLNRKVSLRTDKSPLGGLIDVQVFNFILGVDDPNFLRRSKAALVGLREGAVVTFPDKNGGISLKILKVCHDKLPDPSKCEIPPIDKTATPEFNQCLNPRDPACQQIITKKIYARIEEPEFSFIEYCVTEPGWKCLKLVEAVANLTKINPDFNSRFNPFIESALLFLTEPEKENLQRIVLSSGSLDLANTFIRGVPQEINSKQIGIWLESSASNPVVYKKLTQILVDPLMKNSYYANRLEKALLEIRAPLPPDVQKAIQIRHSRR
jgi:hypothetical protein